MREGAGWLKSFHLSVINIELKWAKTEEHYHPGKISCLKSHSSPCHGLLMRKILSIAISYKTILSQNRECSLSSSPTNNGAEKFYLRSEL